MSSRVAPVLWLAAGVLAVACTPVGSSLEIELPEEDDEFAYEEDEGVEVPDEVAVDEPAPPPTIDVGDALPDTQCTPRTGNEKATRVDDPENPGSGRLLTQLPGGRIMALPLRHTSFDTMVVGTVAETTVTQSFTNPLKKTVEVVYTFPLPHDGAVDDYWIRLDDKVIRGEIHRREEAEEIYEKAKEAGKQAGLLTQERPNIFTQHVANIEPGASIEVSVHLVQPIAPDGGTYELALPTVVGPRYIPGTPTGSGAGTGMIGDTDAVADASKITPPILPQGFRSCGDLEINVSIDAGGPITQLATTSHRIAVEPDHLGAMVKLDESYALLNRDFVLSWRRDGHEPAAILQAQPDGNDGGYFTLTVHPPDQIAPEDVPGREIVFVIDASGSMSGKPMDLAKATMRRFINGLGPDDAFQVIRFSESASGLGDELLAVTPDNISRALEYVDALSGQGGTAMTEGIRKSLGMAHRSDRLRYVVFLTDGYIGNEREIFELITEERGDARLFSLGVGSSVNRYLLDGMARMGQGAVTYVDLEEPTVKIVDRIYEKLRQPALVDLRVELNGFDAHELAPTTMPDLFVGEPVVLFGRYKGKLEGDIVVHGRRGGELVELPVKVHAARDADVDGLRSMWAREKIDELELEPDLAWATSQRKASVQKEVIALSLEHRVLTDYTAFVAVDHTRVVDGHSSGKTLVQGVEMAEGIAHQSVWGHVGPAPFGDDGLGLVGAGGGSGSGYGRGSGAGFGGRGKRVPRVRQAKARVSGAMDRHIIRRIVRAHINEVRHCYNLGLIADPNLKGRVVLQFVINPLGVVATAVISESDLDDKRVGNCIAKAAKKWKFPEVPGGTTAVVHYPFRLAPG